MNLKTARALKRFFSIWVFRWPALLAFALVYAVAILAAWKEPSRIQIPERITEPISFVKSGDGWRTVSEQAGEICLLDYPVTCAWNHGTPLVFTKGDCIQYTKGDLLECKSVGTHIAAFSWREHP